MREIKFRAWDEVNKRMVEVKEIRFRDSRSTPYELRDESGDVVGQWLIDKPDLMQYTGLKDKNGKEIYEGDIVLYEPDYVRLREKAAVSWGGIGWSPFLYSGGGEFEPSYCTVIGNIYENTELLEK